MPTFDLEAAMGLPEPEDRWEHCHGDVDGWTYGAMWYNAAQQEITAVRGIEDVPEIWAHEIRVPVEVAASAKHRAEANFPDPEDAEERHSQVEAEVEAWQEIERERQVDAQTQEVYTWVADAYVEDYDVERVLRAYVVPREEWDALELYARWLYLADFYGLEEMDSSPDRLTQAALRTRLGGIRL